MVATNLRKGWAGESGGRLVNPPQPGDMRMIWSGWRNLAELALWLKAYGRGARLVDVLRSEARAEARLC